MFVPLVDVLRCVRAHAETWLVASINRAENRYIVDGTLGCPACLTEYPIRGGVAYFSERDRDCINPGADEAQAMRVAAALDLTDRRMTAVLHGSWGAQAQLVAGISPSQLVLVNPPHGMISGDGISVVVSDVAPLAAGSMSAVAIDAPISDELFASLRRSLCAGGRLLAPASLAIPDGFTELARDGQGWVARLDDSGTVSALVPLTRRGS